MKNSNPLFGEHVLLQLLPEGPHRLANELALLQEHVVDVERFVSRFPEGVVLRGERAVVIGGDGSYRGAMALTIGRKSKLPWKYFSSHRTEMAEA